MAPILAEHTTDSGTITLIIVRSTDLFTESLRFLNGEPSGLGRSKNQVYFVQPLPGYTDCTLILTERKTLPEELAVLESDSLPSCSTTLSAIHTSECRAHYSKLAQILSGITLEKSEWESAAIPYLAVIIEYNPITGEAVATDLMCQGSCLDCKTPIRGLNILNPYPPDLWEDKLVTALKSVVNTGLKVTYDAAMYG